LDTGSSKTGDEEQSPLNQPPLDLIPEVLPLPIGQQVPDNVALGQQVPVDAAELMQSVKTLMGVVVQQHQITKQNRQIVQANADARRQEAQKYNVNSGIGAKYSNTLSLNRFVERMNNFELEPGRLLDAQLWMEEVEKTFAALDIPENKKVEYVSYMLTE